MKATRADIKKLIADGFIPVQRMKYVIVPLPPSVNNLFATVRGGRRVKSKAYKAWIAESVPTIEKLFRHESPYAVLMTVCGKVNKQRDIDNMVKPILDCLVQCGVIDNDTIAHVKRVTIEVKEGVWEPCVQVEVKPYEV